MPQRDIVEKADIAVSQLITHGGYLNTEQSNRFIRMVQEQVSLLGVVRTIRMNAPKREINKIGFGNRILRPSPGSGVALAADDRAAPTTEKLTLETSEVIAEVQIPYDVLEDNIERGNLEDTIMEMIVERTSVDLEELLILGDTASSDSYLALFDGALKKISSNIVSHSAIIDRSLFKNGMLAMPNKYLRNRAAMRHFLSPGQEIAYIDTLAERATTLGDTSGESRIKSSPFGVPLEAVALMPDTYGFFTYPQNLIWGIQRQIMIETDRDIRARALVVVLTLRIAFEIEEEEACVKYTNITAP